MRWAMALVALALIGLGGLLTIALCVPWASNTNPASASASLACSVKASCDTGEVAVFRMSGTSNAHAGTVAGSSYGNVVCCGSVAGLGTECTGPHDVALALSSLDNAHVAAEPDATYTTEACLSVSGGYVYCEHVDNCAEGYSCVATISGLTNAHVAACDGAGAYTTKVCCAAQAATSTPTATSTATATSTPTDTPTPTDTYTPTPTDTYTPTPTDTYTPTPTITPTPTDTYTPTPTDTFTPTPTDTYTPTPTITPTPTDTYTPTPTITPTPTDTYTPTATVTSTPMGTPTNTRTPGPAPVGGIAEAPDVDGLGTAAGTGPLGINLPGLLAQLIGLAMVLTVLAAVAVGGWYARRRWQK